MRVKRATVQDFVSACIARIADREDGAARTLVDQGFGPAVVTEMVQRACDAVRREFNMTKGK